MWLQSGEVVAVEDAERRLREQKQAAWLMMRNDALHSFAKQIALRVRPLEERLKGAMRLSEAAIARFASNVDRRLTLKPWEEMLKHPPVRAVMFYVSARWAIGQWAGFVSAMRAELEARRALRTSEAAKAQAALAAKSARLLARHWGFWKWREAMRAMEVEAERRAAMAAQLSEWGLQEDDEEELEEEEEELFVEEDDEEAGTATDEVPGASPDPSARSPSDPNGSAGSRRPCERWPPSAAASATGLSPVRSPSCAGSPGYSPVSCGGSPGSRASRRSSNVVRDRAGDRYVERRRPRRARRRRCRRC